MTDYTVVYEDGHTAAATARDAQEAAQRGAGFAVFFRKTGHDHGRVVEVRTPAGKAVLRVARDAAGRAAFRQV